MGLGLGTAIHRMRRAKVLDHHARDSGAGRPATRQRATRQRAT
jgi:hypothetical protein